MREKIRDYSEPWGILNGEPQITHEKNDKRNHRLTQIKKD